MMFKPVKNTSLITVLFTVLLAACGGGGSDGDDIGAPSVVIQYPPVNSLTDQASIEVRGTAEGRQGSPIISVSVNGVVAQSDDGFATWTAIVPLVLGENTLIVETVDDQSNVDDEAAEVRVQAGAYPFLRGPNAGDVVVDINNNRALVVDSTLDALFAFDLSTGARTVLSAQRAQDNFGAQEPVGGGIDLRNPRYMVFDSLNNRVIVNELLLDQIIAIDLASGERSEFLNQNTGGSGPVLTLLRSQVLDLANNRVLVMDGFNGNVRLFAVDLTTGNRSLISSAGRGSGPSLNVADAIALDAANNRLLAADSNSARGAVIAIDLDSGNRTVLSGFNATNDQLLGAGPEFVSPESVDFDADNGRLLIADASLDSVFIVDLATGERSVVTGNVPNVDDVRGEGPEFIGLVGAVFLGDTQAAAVDRDLDTVVVIDLASGDRRLLPGNAIGEGPRFNTPRGFVQLDDRIFVSDSQSNQILVVDRVTGDRSIFVDGADSLLNQPRALTLDGENNRLLVIDNVDEAARLLTIDLSDQSLTLLSGDGVGIGPELLEPAGVVLDRSNDRLLVVDQDQDALLAIELGTGNRSVITNQESEGPEIGFLTGVALSRDGQTAFLLDSGSSALFAVDLVTGTRTIVSGRIPGTSDFIGSEFDLFDSEAIVLDEANNRALVANVDSEEILSVDLASGVASELSSFAVGAGPQMDEPLAIAFDTDNRLVVLDSAARALFSIDVQTGNRVITSWTDVSPQNNLF